MERVGRRADGVFCVSRNRRWMAGFAAVARDVGGRDRADLGYCDVCSGPIRQGGSGPKALSAGRAVVSTLTTELRGSRNPFPSSALSVSSAIPTSKETRLILWKGAVLMALQRPWFQLEGRPYLCPRTCSAMDLNFSNTFFHWYSRRRSPI